MQRGPNVVWPSVERPASRRSSALGASWLWCGALAAVALAVATAPGSHCLTQDSDKEALLQLKAALTEASRPSFQTRPLTVSSAAVRG